MTDEAFRYDQYVPVEPVCTILEQSEEERQQTLEHYGTALSKATEMLEGYIDKHFDSFNSSIEQFCRMLVQVDTSQLSMDDIKGCIASAAVSLESRDSELLMLRRRAAKTVLLRSLALEIQEVTSTAAQAARLIETQHFLAAVQKLERLSLLLVTKSGIAALASAESFLTSTRATLHMSVSEALVSGVLRLQHVQDDAVVSARLRRFINRRNSLSSGDVGFGSTVAPELIVSGRLDVHNVTDDVDEANPASDFAAFGLKCVAALLSLNRLEDARALFLKRLPLTLNKLMDTLIQAFVSFNLALLRPTSTRQGSPSTDGARMGTGAAGIALHVSGTLIYNTLDDNASLLSVVGSEAAVDRRVAEQQAAIVGDLVAFVTAELEKVLRNVTHLVYCVVARRFPFLAPVIGNPSLLCDESKWAVEEAVVPAAGWRQIRSNVEAQCRMKLSDWSVHSDWTPENRAEASTLTAQLFSVLGDSWFDAAATQPLTVNAALDKLDGCAEHVGETYAKTLEQGTLLESCAEMLRDATLDSCRSHVLAEVGKCVQQWDVARAWSEVQMRVQALLACLLNQSDTMQGTANANLGAQLRARAVRKPQRQPPAKPLLSTLSVLINNWADGVPAFLSELGVVDEATIIDEAESFLVGDATTAGSSAAAAAPVSRPSPTASPQALMNDRIVKALDPLRPFYRFSRHNLPFVVPPATAFTQSCEHRLQWLVAAATRTSGRPAAPLAGASMGMPRLLRSFVRNVIINVAIPQCREANMSAVRKLLSGSDALAPRRENVTTGTMEPMNALDLPDYLSADYVTSSARPVLRVIAFVDRAVSDIFEFAVHDRESAAAACWEADKILGVVAMAFKRTVDWLAEGSFAHRAISPLFQAAFDHQESASATRWRSMCVDDPGDAHQYIHGEIASLYDNLCKERSSMSSGGATLDATQARRLKQLRVQPAITLAAIALICHSLEWLADRYLFRAKGWPPQSNVAHVPGSRLDHVISRGSNSASSFRSGQDASDEVSLRFPDNTLAVYLQLMSVAQAALFILSTDCRSIACVHIPELRDLPLELLTCPRHPDPFVGDFGVSLGGFFGAVTSHLQPPKLAFIATTLATPVASLFVAELSHLRKKIVTAAGQQRLMIDLLCIQQHLQHTVPTNGSVVGAVAETLRPVFEYCSLLTAGDSVVREIVTRKLFLYFKRLELENLVALVFHNDTHTGFAKGAQLREQLDAISLADKEAKERRQRQEQRLAAKGDHAAADDGAATDHDHPSSGSSRRSSLLDEGHDDAGGEHDAATHSAPHTDDDTG